MPPVLNVATELIWLDEQSADYLGARKRYFVALARQYPGAWNVHKINRQFKLIDGVTSRPAVKHCVVQLARARVLGRLLGLPLHICSALQEAALLHDSFKAEEVRYMLREGCNWHTYDHAQTMARRSWEASGLFSPMVMDIAAAVAHESLVRMIQIRNQACGNAALLPPFMIAQMAMHYLDDTAVDDRWATPAVNGRNVLDARTERNAQNSRYQLLNQQGVQELPNMARAAGLDPAVFLPGETTYDAQARIGHDVETLLAQIVMQRAGVSFDPLNLPVIVDNVIRRELLDLMAQIKAEEEQAIAAANWRAT